MKVYFIITILFYQISVISSKTLLNNDATIVDIVIKGLKDRTWSEDETPCLDQTLTILNNVKNYTVWAVWVWNSMHHPVGTLYGSEYNLGNYDQCLNAPTKSADPKIITQYCLTDVTLTRKKYEDDSRNNLGSTAPYVATKTSIGRDFNKITWGTCLPSICKPGAISKILKTIYMTNPITPAEPEITVDYCEVAGETRVLGFGFYAFMTLITCLIGLSMLTTYYYHHEGSKCQVMNCIADSFCMKRNWTSLTKRYDDEIGMLNFLKVVLAAFAVSVHTAFFEVMAPISNGVYLDEMILDTKNPLNNAVKHIDLPVDNFLMISGLLLMKGLMEKRKKPLVGLVNRYFRLTSSFAMVMFYMAAVSMNTGDGPVWQRFAGKEQKACSKNWLLGILMMNNYVDSENICLLVSWYIPCDYQLAIMGTILYLIWQKDKRIGKIVTAFTVILAWVIPGMVTYWKKLPGTVLFHDIYKILDFRKNEVYLDTYIRSHNRAGPYLIGMAMGYIMHVYKPQKHRNAISKEKSLILLAISSIIVYRLIMVTLSWSTLEYDHFSSAIYAVLSRNLWALATCLTIGVVEYGDLAKIRNFTNWHGFSVLSRLAFGVYLTHSIILQQNMYSRRNLQQFDYLYSETVHSFGVLVTSALVATLLWMFVEAPLNNIVNACISGTKPIREQATKLAGTGLQETDYIDKKIKGI